jgi:hypothetical protein
MREPVPGASGGDGGQKKGARFAPRPSGRREGSPAPLLTTYSKIKFGVARERFDADLAVAEP